MKSISALIAGGILTASSFAVYAELIDEGRDTVAIHSIGAVNRSAYIEHLMQGTPWPEALAQTAGSLYQGRDNIVVVSTTVRWVQDDYCVQAELPEPETPVVLGPCPITG